MDYLSYISAFSILLGILNLYIWDTLKPVYHKYSFRELFNCFLFASLAWPYYVTYSVTTALYDTFSFVVRYIINPTKVFFEIFDMKETKEFVFSYYLNKSKNIH